MYSSAAVNRFDPDNVLEQLYINEEQIRTAQRALRGVDRDGIHTLEGTRQQVWDLIRRRKAHLKRW